MLPTPDLWPLARANRRKALVDGHRMVWLERGAPGPDRPTVVLLHGFAAMKENWGLWLPRLPRDWHLLVPDLPGLGESDYRMFNSVGNGKPTPMGVALTGLLAPDLLRRTEALRHIFADVAADALAPARYLGQSQIPLQVQWGDRDVITPTRCVDYFRTHTPQADIRVFRGVGHLPMIEAPGASARALTGFIRQLAYVSC